MDSNSLSLDWQTTDLRTASATTASIIENLRISLILNFRMFQRSISERSPFQFSKSCWKCEVLYKE